MTSKSVATLVLLLIASALSGCVGDKGAEKVTTSNGAGDGSDAGDDADDTIENAAPEAFLAATTGGVPVEPEAGVITIEPGTSLTFDASGSSDIDGDVLAFAWTIDGVAQESTEPTLDADLEEGDHAVAVTVSDGELESIASLEVEVAALLAPPPLAGAGIIMYTFTGSFAQGDALGEQEAGPSVFHPFDVPLGTKQLTARFIWGDGLVNAVPLWADLDIHLLPPGVEDKEDAAASSNSLFDFEYIRFNDTESLVAGTWKAQLEPWNVPVDVEYEANIIVWLSAPTTIEFTGSHRASQRYATTVGEDLGASSPDMHVVSIPDDAHAVAGRLVWINEDPDDLEDPCDDLARAETDYDLSAIKGEEIQFSAGYALACEFGFKAAPAGETLGPGGEWTFNVSPYQALNSTYVLQIDYA